MNTDHQSEKDYLKELAPNLFAKKIESEIDAPEGYFNSLEKRVIEKRDAQLRSTKAPIRANRKSYLLRFGLAAGVALLLAFLSYINWNQQSAADNLNLQSALKIENFDPEILDAESIQAYLLEDGSEYELPSGELLAELSAGELADEALIDYLLEPTLFNDDLVNQLYEN